jgi:hypothetical protein
MVALLIALSLTACGADQVTGRVGETLVAGDYELTVQTMENPANPPDRFTNPKPGNRFVKFDFAMANRGNQHLPVAPAYFVMKDTGGIDNTPREGISSDGVLRATSLAPGQRLQSSLYFEMAANQSPSELVFAPGVVGWRTKITVLLR